MYLVGLGVQNLLFYDVSLGKIERVQILDDGGMGNSGGMGEPDHNSLTKNMYIFVIIGDRFELN
jgi:hypothetical protein